MSNEQKNHDLQSLWQSQPAPHVSISMDEMRARAATFERKVRRRNWTEYVASGFVIVAFGWYATWPEPATPLWPIANIAIIVGTLVMIWNLHRFGPDRAPDEAPVATLLDFHRGELVRQRDALRTVWLWYIGPFAPGLVLWFAALWIGTPEAQQTATWGMGLALAAGVSVAVSAGIIALNLFGAARLQRLIDEIDSYRT